MRSVRGRLLPFSGGLIVSLVAGLVAAIPAAAVAADPKDPPPDTSVPVSSVAAKGAGLAPMPEDKAKSVAWPKTGVAELDLPPSATRSLSETGVASAAVGGLPVQVKGVPGAVDTLSLGTDLKLPAKVRVEVLPRGKDFPLNLRLSRVDGSTANGRVQVRVDYSGFRHAYGGDWGSRLRLAVLPACWESTPDAKGCRTPALLPTSNDHKSGVLTAEVDLDGTKPVAPMPQTGGRGGSATDTSGTMLAVVATASSPESVDFGVTDLKATGSWQAGASSGAFSWNYPMNVPPVPAGLTPNAGLSYSSASVDGQVSGKNTQVAWGEGWSFEESFIERTYRTCADDYANNPHWVMNTGDLCFRVQNAHMNFMGKSVELILADDGGWRAEDDEIAKVELITGGSSTGYHNAEKWRITTVDGTQYYFGLNQLPGFEAGDRTTGSVLGVPVFANHAGEPCFSTESMHVSGCGLAYRWNLDYVVDPNGNTMSYWYAKEWNTTSLNGDPNRYTAYERGAVLGRIEYGTRAGTGAARESSPNATPPARLWLSWGNRCLAADCNPNVNWPDTPWDLHCAAGPCPNNLTPTFWTSFLRKQISTEVWSGSGQTYNLVDRWDLSYSFPDTGSGLAPALWLEKISHAGHAGGTLSTPDTVFHGRKDNNRADYDPNASMAAHWKYRIDAINTNSGGQILVTYNDVTKSANCQFGSAFPDPDNNASRCFPKWYVNPSGSGGFSWWHKLLVDKVVERDLVGGSPDVEHAYTYSTDGSSTPVLWSHDAGAAIWSTTGARRSWSDWRGYSTVTETVGASKTTTLYFRGLDKTMTDAGENARSASVTNSLGEVTADSKGFGGMAHEVQTFDGTQVIEKKITDPVGFVTGARLLSSTIAYPSKFESVLTRVSKERELTWLPATSGWRTTQTVNTWDSRWGVITKSVESGDVAVTGDEKCTDTSYGERDMAKWFIDYPSAVVGTACDPRNHLSGTQYFYDGSTTLGAKVSGRGLVTMTKSLQVPEVTTGDPVLNWQQASRATHDAWGRVQDSFDALDRKTMTRYTHTAGILTKLEVTNPAGYVSSTTFERMRGLLLTATDANGKVTTGTYDPLGRLLKVWKPGHPTSGTPDMEYQYTLQSGASSFVKTRALAPNGNQIDSYQIFDGLLRQRQAQTPTHDGKRSIVDTVYDHRGNVAKSSTFYNADSAPTSVLVAGADSAIDRQQRFVYDGAGRRTKVEDYQKNALVRSTTTIYGGDRVSTVPPAGGTLEQVVLNTRGDVVEKRQFVTGDLNGAFDKTTYKVDVEGQLLALTDPAGNSWKYSYDTLGRQIMSIDPDTGTSSAAYDNAGQLLTTTDGRGVQLAYSYDSLGRKTGVFEGTTAGAKRAGWMYDTLQKGQQTSSTRYDGGLAYTQAVTGYDDGYRPTGTTLTIPASTANGALAGTYSTAFGYKANGALASQTFQAVGGLPAETVTSTYYNSAMPYELKSADQVYVGGTAYHYDGQQYRAYLGPVGKQLRLQYDLDANTRSLTQLWTNTEISAGVWESNHFVNRYGHDAAGNIVWKNTYTNKAFDIDECFRYDYLRRLTTAWTTAGGCANPERGGSLDPYWREWTFDKVGNRLTQVDKDPVAGDTTWSNTVGTKPHQVSKVDAVGPKAGTASRSFGYDAAGNMNSRTTEAGGTQTLTWDKEGHLAAVAEGSSTTSYVYDASGNRLMSRSPSKTTLYLSDGTELELPNGGGAVLGTRSYQHNGKTVGVRSAAGLRWVMQDQQGTTSVQIDSVTLQGQRRRSLPYGEARGSQPSGWLGTKGFVGGTKDDTGLTHLGAREYDPTLGRFISRDPVVDSSDPQQMHGYAYSHNSPITFSDPDGLKDCDYASCDADGSNNDSSSPDHGRPSGGKPGGGRYDDEDYDEMLTDWAAERERQRQLAEQIEAQRRRELEEMTARAIVQNWLFGQGSRSFSFQEGDIYTSQMRSHWSMGAIRSRIADQLAQGRSDGRDRYSLSGIEGVTNYARDALAGNGSGFVTGSYQLKWEVIGRHGDGSFVVRMRLSNTMSLQSGTRPPIIGYTDWWTNGPGRIINDAVATGPMSAVTMEATWTETIHVD